MKRNTRQLLDLAGTLGGHDLPHRDRALGQADAGSEPRDEAALGADEFHTVHADNIRDPVTGSQAIRISQGEICIAADDINPSDTTTMELGNIIRQARRRMGLRQIDLARLLKVKQSAVSQWENGTYAPEIDNRIRLAALLHIALHDLLPGAKNISEDALADPQVRRLVDAFLSLDQKHRAALELIVLQMQEAAQRDR